MEIRKTSLAELDSICEFYDNQIDLMRDCGYFTLWEKGIYPDRERIRGFIEAGSMFAGWENGAIIAAMALNSDGGAEYDNVRWSVAAAPGEVLVIHILAVSLKCKNRGLGRQMLEFAIAHAKSRSMKTIRMDVHSSNTTALKLYEKMDFTQLETVSIFYDGLGLHDFIMHELAI